LVTELLIWLIGWWVGCLIVIFYVFNPEVEKKFRVHSAVSRDLNCTTKLLCANYYKKKQKHKEKLPNDCTKIAKTDQCLSCVFRKLNFAPCVTAPKS
jgi:hypothetical protein